MKLNEAIQIEAELNRFDESVVFRKNLTPFVPNTKMHGFKDGGKVIGEYTYSIIREGVRKWSFQILGNNQKLMFIPVEDTRAVNSAIKMKLGLRDSDMSAILRTLVSSGAGKYDDVVQMFGDVIANI